MSHETINDEKYIAFTVQNCFKNIAENLVYIINKKIPLRYFQNSDEQASLTTDVMTFVKDGGGLNGF